MNTRSPALRYLLVWLTGGIFMFWWPFLLLRELNSVWPSVIANNKKLEFSYFALACIYSGFLVGALVNFPAGHTPYLWGMIPLLLFLFGVPIYAVTTVAKALQEKNIKSPRPAVAAILFFIYGISLPILQACINNLEANESGAT